MPEDREPATAGGESQAIIKLNPNPILYFREVNRFLALVCRLPQEHFDKPGLIDYNFEVFKNAITEVREGAQGLCPSLGWSLTLPICEMPRSEGAAGFQGTGPGSNQGITVFAYLLLLYYIKQEAFLRSSLGHNGRPIRHRACPGWRAAPGGRHRRQSHRG